MFGFIDDVASGFVDAADSFVRNPVKTTVNMALQPVRDTLIIIDGLTEGELRTEAILRVGVDSAVGMGVSELIDLHNS